MSKQQALLLTPPFFPKEHPYEMDNFYGFECSFVMVMVGLQHQENVMSAKERIVLFVKAVED